MGNLQIVLHSGQLINHHRGGFIFPRLHIARHVREGNWFTTTIISSQTPSLSLKEDHRNFKLKIAQYLTTLHRQLVRKSGNSFISNVAMHLKPFWFFSIFANPNNAKVHQSPSHFQPKLCELTKVLRQLLTCLTSSFYVSFRG